MSTHAIGVRVASSYSSCSRILDGARTVEYREITWLLPGKFDEHVDGGGQGKDVIKLNDVRVAARPNVCKGKNLKRKPAGVRWES